MEEYNSEKTMEEMLQMMRDLSAKVDRLETQVNEMKSAKEIERQMAFERTPLNQPMQRPMGQPMQRPMGQPMQRPMGQPMQRPLPGENSMSNAANRMPQKPVARKSGVEVILGQAVMPILAIVLILTGVGVFAASYWKSLSDVVKAGLVLVLGGAIAGVGILLGKKEKMYRFKLTTFATAFAVVFMDICASTLIWHLFDLTVSFVLILVWCVACVLLSEKYQEYMFYLVSFAGLLVEAIVIAVRPEFGIVEFIFLMLLAIVLAGCAYFVKKNFDEYNWVSCIFGSILVLIQGFCMATLQKTTAYLTVMYPIFAVIVATYGVLCPLLLKRKENKSYGTAERVVYAVFAFIGPVSVLLSLRCADAGWGFLVFPVAAVFCLSRSTRQEALLGVGTPTLITMCLLSSRYLDSAFWGAILFAFGFTLVCAFIKKLFYRYYAFCAATIAVLGGYVEFLERMLPKSDMHPALMYIMEYAALFVVLSILMGVLIREKERGLLTAVFPILITVVDMLQAAVKKGVDWPDGITALGNILVFVLFVIFAVTWLRKSEEVFVEAYLFSGIMAIIFLIGYSTAKSAGLQVVLGMLVLLFAGVAAYVVRLKKDTNAWLIAAFLSLLIIDYFELTSHMIFFKNAMIVSIGMVVIAFLFVMVGFARKIKAVRLYGLIFMLVSVFKMLLLDIGTESVAVRVICFISAGLICLGSSYVYNCLEKNLNLK